MRWILSLARANERGYPCIKPFASYRHFWRVERIFHHSVGVNIVDFLQYYIRFALC